MQVWKSKTTMEGAGVRLKRVFGHYEVPKLDPFLLLDNLGSDDPDDYLAGFPWHPHRGIETVTYMLEGSVEHGDSLGNSGVINSGDVQWMTAGGGIIHQEMPKRYDGRMRGFQLWVNLPKKEKMMVPRYRDVLSSQIPEIELDGGVRVKIICGRIGDASGPVRDLVVDVAYFDVTLPPGTIYEPGSSHERMFAFVFEGSGEFGGQHVETGMLALFEDGDVRKIIAYDDGVRFILISGNPLDEPVAWRGPIVMNTQDELDTAFREYHQGTFIK